MGNFFKMMDNSRPSKAYTMQDEEAPKHRGRTFKEIERTGKTIREIFRKEANQTLDSTCAVHHDAEQLTEESVPHRASNHSDVAEPSGAEQHAEESLLLLLPTKNSTEQPVEVSAQQTPRTVSTDSGYNSPQDETSAWEKILEMREREYQDDLAAMLDVHEDELKYLRNNLSSEIRKKELLQKRVKKEVLAKQDLKRQLDSLQLEHRAALEASKGKDREIEEKEMEALALRSRFQEMEKGFQNKEKLYLRTIKAQGEEATAKEEETQDLRMRVYEVNSDILNKEGCDRKVFSQVGTNAQDTQNGDVASSAQWRADYHRACEEAQLMRRELQICSSQREQAISFTNDLEAQLELAKDANGKLLAAVNAKQTELEVDGRYHEQIRSQNRDLQQRINESTVDVAKLKYQKANTEQEAAAEVKDLRRRLDNRTADLSALQATKAAWQADPEGVLLTLSQGVTSDDLILALAKRLELTLDENDSWTERVVVRERDYDALKGQLRLMKAQRDGLSQSLAGKAEEATSLKEKIHDLETQVISREMDDEVDKRLEPLYLHALEEAQQLREAAAEHENGVGSEGLRTQLDHARRAALQNRQQHIAEIESLKDLLEKVYGRVLRMEATLTAAGRTIEEPNKEGEVLKAECARVLGYIDDESEPETGGPDNTRSGSETSEAISPDSQSNDHEREVTSQSEDTSNHTGLTDEPTSQSEDEADDRSEAETEQALDSTITRNVRRFVLRSLAEGGARTRVLGESSSPAATATPDSNPPSEEDGEDVHSDREDGTVDDDGGGDSRTYHPRPLAVASLAWVKRNRPFAYGEPVGDDQFGKEALRARH